jgi:hypothetical protein
MFGMNNFLKIWHRIRSNNFRGAASNASSGFWFAASSRVRAHSSKTYFGLTRSFTGSLRWSGGQSSLVQIQRFGFNFRRYQIFWEVVGLERGPLGLVSTILRPPLWSSGQSSWLLIQSSGFNSRCYQIFWEVVGLERGPLSLVGTIEEPVGRKSSGFGLENRECGRRDPSRWLRGTLYPRKLALTSPTSVGRSVGKVRSRTLTTGVVFAPCLSYVLSHQQVSCAYISLADYHCDNSPQESGNRILQTIIMMLLQ